MRAGMGGKSKYPDWRRIINRKKGLDGPTHTDNRGMDEKRKKH